MDIHAPEGPTNSFKDFAIHIVIVTIGILIALGLEGIRETIYEHRIVRDARENFHAELEANRSNLDKELENDARTLAQLNQIVVDLPELHRNPTQFAARVSEIKPSGYFFSSSRWESSLSTGALGHMSVDEVNRYAEVNFLVHTYSGLENHANADWVQLEAFFGAHPNPSPEQVETGTEKLLIYRSEVRGLNQVAKEFSSSIDKALSKN